MEIAAMDGHEVRPAADVEQAVEQTCEFCPGVIFMDLDAAHRRSRGNTPHPGSAQARQPGSTAENSALGHVQRHTLR
jgi:hypothetical protein